jgi:hypothetical protein
MPTPGPSGFGIVDIRTGTIIWSSDSGTPAPGKMTVITFNQTPNKAPDKREVVIVYFKEMPESMKQFAYSYDIVPIFIKEEIKIAAFDLKPIITDKMDVDTTAIIEKISKDPLVELAKRDTYYFVDREKEINTTTSVKYPKDYRDGDYVPDEVVVGFWRLPPYIEEFGIKYGGKPIDVYGATSFLPYILYETGDMESFIDLASKDPYVRYIELNVIFKIDEATEGYIEYII